MTWGLRDFKEMGFDPMDNMMLMHSGSGSYDDEDEEDCAEEIYETNTKSTRARSTPVSDHKVAKIVRNESHFLLWIIMAILFVMAYLLLTGTLR